MRYLDFSYEKEHLKRIKSALKRRNLQIDETDEWEIHGPHPERNYQVYIGRVYKELDHNLTCNCSSKGIDRCDKHKDGFYVVLYPWAVYEIQEPGDWRKAAPLDRISVIKLRKPQRKYER